MTFYKLSKKQDLAKSMLEVGLINLFGCLARIKNFKTIFRSQAKLKKLKTFYQVRH